ncbi:MAG: DUF3786 domain-containing protein [Candidatus Omnitrophica bacterium]|nr:DUF3786 domain-containing protein [Candidatus Omnitrophota bacterium]
MSYTAALEKAWKELLSLTREKRISVRFLSDTYEIDPAAKRIISSSDGAQAKDYIAIILLHYLIKKLRYGAIPARTGEWIDFNGLEGGEGYYPTFRKRTIDVVVSKYGGHPEALYKALERFPGKKSDLGDVGVEIYPVEGIAILIKASRADEEFGPDANILFDSGISKIFCTEDIVVLTEILIHQL